jgi:hypothetical protein
VYCLVLCIRPSIQKHFKQIGHQAVVADAVVDDFGDLVVV